MTSVLLQPQNLVRLSRAVSRELGQVELTTDENAQLIKLAKRINTHKVNQYSIEELIASLAKVAAKKIKTHNKESIVAKVNYENVYDVTQLFGISDKHTLLRILNPSALYDYKFVILSTANNTLIADNPYTFNWQIMENDTLSTGMVNIKPIKNIVGIRLFPMKFIFAYSTYLSLTTASNAMLYANYVILIKELVSQSILGYNNMRYHFFMTSQVTTYNTSYIELTAKKENSFYWYNPPIITMPSITLTIGNYLGQTGFPLSFIPALISLSNPATVYIPNATISLTTGMICKFYDPVIYNPTTVTNSTFINALTVGSGLAITVIAPSSSYTRFTIPINGTVISSGDVPTTILYSSTGSPVTYVNVYIPASTSTIIPMCIICLKS